MSEGVWLSHVDGTDCENRKGDLVGVECAQCGIRVADKPHIHINYPAPDFGAAGVCSEGCAIQLVQQRDFIVVPRPVEALA